MLTIERSSSFKRDYRRVKASPRHAKDLDELLAELLALLAAEKALPDKCRDHPLIGDWAGYRECHIKPDLLLIYRTVDTETLRLARVGSHSALFG
jgi:mRNA interferase YafQ